MMLSFCEHIFYLELPPHQRSCERKKKPRQKASAGVATPASTTTLNPTPRLMTAIARKECHLEEATRTCVPHGVRQAYLYIPATKHAPHDAFPTPQRSRTNYSNVFSLMIFLWYRTAIGMYGRRSNCGLQRIFAKVRREDLETSGCAEQTDVSSFRPWMPTIVKTEFRSSISTCSGPPKACK